MTDQPIEANLQSRKQYWQKQIESWEASKLTQAEYCLRNGFKTSQFLYWKTKLRGRPKSNVSFVQVPLQPTNESRLSGLCPIRIVIRDRFHVEIAPGFDAETLQKLIHSLERL